MFCKQNWKNRFFVTMITGHSKENILLQLSVRRQVLLPAGYFIPQFITIVSSNLEKVLPSLPISL